LNLKSEIVERSGSGIISGLVFGYDSDVKLVGCAVEVLGTDYGTVAGADGTFRIHSVPPGTYSLRFSMVGYDSRTLDSVTVTQTADLEIRVELGPETVENDFVI
jgi:hypothetical protein